MLDFILYKNSSIVYVHNNKASNVNMKHNNGLTENVINNATSMINLQKIRVNKDKQSYTVISIQAAI